MKLEETIGQLLVGRRLTLAIAESCIIAYAYEAKERLLGVRPETLVNFGAVSEQTAREMARGARRVLGAHLAVAVTGIAGPGGATPEKPLGLTWIALCAPDFEQAQRYVWDGDRQSNKAQSAEAALRLVEEYLRRENPGAGEPGGKREAS